MTTEEPSDVPIGTVLEGKFLVTQEIGRGGMAAVYEAENVDIGKRVAVKVLSADLITSRIVRERFLREARAASAIHSPYICQVFDFGMYDDRPFLVMELMRGESLFDRMTRIRQLKVSTTLKVMRHVIRGLSKAHHTGVVHRDLKPENIFLTRDDEGRLVAKVLDFGLAKFYESRDGEPGANERLTREGALFGTPAYMSPEQAKGQGGVDYRADLWALACIVYECLTGRTVWDVQQGVAMILAQIARGKLPDPLEFRPDLPEEFRHWFRQALHPKIEQRYQTAQSFYNALDAALRGDAKPISSLEPALPASASSTPATTAPTPVAPPVPGQRPWVAFLGLGTIASLTLGFYGYWLYFAHPPPSKEELQRASTTSTPQEIPPRSPLEKGPGAKLIGRAQKLLRNDQPKAALRELKNARGETPHVAGSLIAHAEVALAETGPCQLAGLGRPRPFDVNAPASHPRLALGGEGILVAWTDTHQDPKRRNVYTSLLDDSLRRVGRVNN
ncbi:MAG: serine/threonine protein kinase, partial [Polyangiaceae bacterium]|nr:serine/threonine protein kinase [Polyangiaceae bacterium]